MNDKHASAMMYLYVFADIIDDFYLLISVDN